MDQKTNRGNKGGGNQRGHNFKDVSRETEPQENIKLIVEVSGNQLRLSGGIDETTRLGDLHTKLKHLARESREYSNHEIVIVALNAYIVMEGIKRWTDAVSEHLADIKIRYEWSQLAHLLQECKPYLEAHKRSTFADREPNFTS